MPTQPNGASDQQAQAVLDKLRLDLFKAEPSSLGPFQAGTLSWEVTVPDSDVAVRIRLDGEDVETTGEVPISPPLTETYRLTALAGRYSRLLGEVTVPVDISSCTTLRENWVEKLVAAEIKAKIQARTDGIYLKTNPFFPDLVVTITQDRMNVYLVLGKKVNNFPDPTITITSSFGLDIVPGPPPRRRPPLDTALPPVRVPPVIGAVNQDINVDISFPWYAWLVPGAMIGLPIAISNGEADAERDTASMIDSIAAGLDGLIAAPPNTYKEHVALYVDGYGDSEFEVTFCPPPPLLTALAAN